MNNKLGNQDSSSYRKRKLTNEYIISKKKSKSYKHTSKKSKFTKDPNLGLLEKKYMVQPEKIMHLENIVYNSNHLLELQVTELLSKRKLSPKILKHLDSFLCIFKRNLKIMLPSKENLERISCPLEDNNDAFTYKPSENVTFLYPLQTVLIDDITFIHLTIEIPKLCIHSKDYLNEGYLRRRAQYLKHVMAVLYNIPSIYNIQFCVDFNIKKPKISFSVYDFKKYRITFILETNIKDVFTVNRFISNFNNVRKNYYIESYKMKVPEIDDSFIFTPHYNSWILEDMLIKNHHIYLNEQLKNMINFLDALVLIKLWISKNKIFKYFIFDIMITYVVYLWKKNKINEQMSPLEIFRIVLFNIGESSWNIDWINLTTISEHYIALSEDMKNNFNIIFTDISGNLNLCHDWNINEYMSLRHEAKMTCLFIDSNAIDKLRQLFIDQKTFFTKYDYIFHIDKKCLKNIFSESEKLAPLLIDYCGDYIKVATTTVFNILQKGLSNRILYMDIDHQGYKFFLNYQFNFQEECLTFGLLLDKNALNISEEKGPAANSEDAVTFLKLWGDLSEQYLYPGEQVCEVVKWEGNTFLERRLIIMKIIKHLLQRHVNINKKCLIFYDHHFNNLLQSEASLNCNIKESIGTGEEIHGFIIQSFDSLSKVLRNISDLPLPINSVQGLSPIFRHTEVIPHAYLSCKSSKTELINNCIVPTSHSVPSYNPYYEVLGFLEASGKWPENKEAVKRLKAAFYIKLASILKKYEYFVKINTSFIDVMPLNTSIVFRLKVGFLQEINLSKKTTLEDGKIMMIENKNSKNIKMRLITRPQFSSTILGLQQQHNTFGCVSRLCKRWVSSQLLNRQFLPEAIELIVAYLYISPRSQNPPCSLLSGFIHFLHLISNYEWKLQPLIINFNNKFTQSDYDEIELYYSKSTSNPLMFISYPDDKLSNIWIQDKLTKLVFNRLIAVAKASLMTVENSMKNYSQSLDDFKRVFRPPLHDFDIIINLRTELCSRYSEYIDYNIKNKKILNKNFFNYSNLYPVIDFDPVQLYLSDLETLLSDFLIFFHDQYGGSIIACVWKNFSFVPIKFDESKMEFRRLSDKKSEEGLMIPCIEKIIEKINFIGKGIVLNITVN